MDNLVNQNLCILIDFLRIMYQSLFLLQSKYIFYLKKITLTRGLTPVRVSIILRTMSLLHGQMVSLLSVYFGAFASYDKILPKH
jgi:hypothetical protein